MLVGTKNGVYTIYVYLWSDDADPNNSTKANRNSAWILAVTFGHTFTFIVSMGRKGADHSFVESKVLEDLTFLDDPEGKLFYYKFAKKEVRIRVKLLVRLADSPERHDFMKIKRGNGIYTSWWGYMCDAMQNIEKVPACYDCAKQTEKNALTGSILNANYV